jgi:hypothetical protein
MYFRFYMAFYPVKSKISVHNRYYIARIHVDSILHGIEPRNIDSTYVISNLHDAQFYNIDFTLTHNGGVQHHLCSEPSFHIVSLSRYSYHVRCRKHDRCLHGSRSAFVSPFYPPPTFTAVVSPDDTKPILKIGSKCFDDGPNEINATLPT